jgi:hypothetical protein
MDACVASGTASPPYDLFPNSQQRLYSGEEIAHTCPTNPSIVFLKKLSKQEDPRKRFGAIEGHYFIADESLQT